MRSIRSASNVGSAHRGFFSLLMASLRLVCPRNALSYLSLLWISVPAMAQNDSVFFVHPDGRHLGAEVEGSVGRVLHMDQYDRLWMKRNPAWSAVLQARYYTLPSDSDDYARAYGFPSFSLGLLYSDYSGVRMHKDQPDYWGSAVPVDYVSDAGRVVTLFGTFERTLFRAGRWSFDYLLGVGLGIALNPYDSRSNVDNELIGSVANIYFTGGLHMTYQFSGNWGLRAGLDFRHHSNGATARPNKGSNYLAPTLGLLYTPVPLGAYEVRNGRGRAFEKTFYGILGLGLGGKTLLEEWQYSQFRTPAGTKGYRKQHYHFYPTYSLEGSLMYRYALRWASGLGVDVNYASAVDKIKEIDELDHHSCRHSPWSFGIAARHEAFYHRLSVAVSLGVYLFREMGATADWEEKFYYERVGLRYYFSRHAGFYLGAEVKAHATRADFTQLTFGYRL